MQVTPIDWPQALISQNLKTARRVGRVVPGTPAHYAGIKTGWLVLAVNGEPATDINVTESFIKAVVEVVFQDPDTDTCVSWTGAGLPPGFDILPVFNAAYGIEIRTKQAMATDWLKAWQAGDIVSYAALRKDFEVALKPLTQNLFGRFISQDKQHAAMLGSDDRWSQLGLALVCLAEGDVDMAGRFAQAYFDTLDRDPHGGSDMSITLAAAYYVLAVAWAGDVDKHTAKNMVEAALSNDPSAVPARVLYGELFGVPFDPPAQPLAGHPFPARRYSLHQYDPFELWPHAGAELSLSKAVAGLKDGAYGLVCVLGPYRSNGPFLEDLHRLLALQRTAAPHNPAFVHVITAWTGDPTTQVSQHRIRAERTLIDAGLVLQIGYDADDTVAPATQTAAFPTWFVVGPQAVVKACGTFDSAEVLSAVFATAPTA